MIKPCMANWGPLQRPFDPKTKKGMERFVAPVFWAAEQMMLGRVAQCYKMAGETPALIVDRSMIEPLLGNHRVRRRSERKEIVRSKARGSRCTVKVECLSPGNSKYSKLDPIKSLIVSIRAFGAIRSSA